MERPLRIWHIAESYPPDYGGGAAVTTRETCEALARRGHDVRVLAVGDFPGEPYSVRAEAEGTVRTIRVNLPHLRNVDPEGWQLGMSAWRAHEQRVRRVLTALVHDWRPDVADYHGARPLGETCLMTIRSLGIPMVATLHDFWLVCPRVMLMRSPVGQPCEGPALGRCHLCLYSHYDGSVVTAGLKMPWRLLRLGSYPAYRLAQRRRARSLPARAIARSEFIARVCRPFLRCEVEVIALGVDQSDLPTSAPGRPRHPFRFGFMAGAQPTKGLDLVLGAAGRLVARGLQFEVLVFGPHPERATEAVRAHSLDKSVRVMGTYSSQDRWLAYAQIDAAVMATTVCEPLGRVPQEAAASGAPAIVPAIGGLVESVSDEVNGLLFPFRSSDHLAAQMERILLEPGLYDRLRAGLTNVPEPRDSAAAVEAVYLAALASTSGDSPRRLR